jgi:hypothetical protein
MDNINHDFSNLFRITVKILCKLLQLYGKTVYNVGSGDFIIFSFILLRRNIVNRCVFTAAERCFCGYN